MHKSCIFILSLVFSSLMIAKCRNAPTIYELNTRAWLYDLTQKYSKPITKIADIPFEEFQAIANLGVDYIWMMGIWEIGEYGLNYDRTNQDLINFYNQVLPGWKEDDVIGSPYSIVEFTCNPSVGSDQDILDLKKKLNAIGVKLMLDFVPNHTAYDCPLTSSDINMYIRAPPNTPTPYDSQFYFPDGISYGGDQWDHWYDVAQLNYWNDTTFEHMKQTMGHLATMADALRCDMAMLVMNKYIQQDWNKQLSAWGYKQPDNEFWDVAIKYAKEQNPDLITMAEVYWGANQDILNLGFDLVYDKDLLDAMATFSAQNVRNYIKSKDISYLKQANHFVENHDEPRAVAKFGHDYIANTAAMIAYTIPGSKFVNNGQTDGYKNKLAIQLRRAEAESGSNYSRWWYSRLLPILNDDVFHNGDWTYLDVNDDDNGYLLAWKWTSDKAKRLCVINFSDTQSFGRVVLSDAESPNGNDMYNITELMSGDVYKRSAQKMRTEGLGVIVDAWNGQIFEY